jgi:hypothetical protein
MKPIVQFAIFLVAAYAFSTCARAQEVYRCGNTYSQKPCTDGVVVGVQDARTPDQKEQADALTRHDAAAANAMEKARLKEEAREYAANAKLAAAAAKRASSAAKPKDGKQKKVATRAHKTQPEKKSSKKNAQPNASVHPVSKKPGQPTNSARL